jgi:hypothetical protein
VNFQRHHLHHVAAIEEAGEFVADGDLAIAGQGQLEVGTVFAKLVAHGAELP